MFSYFSNHFYSALSHSHNPLYIIADRGIEARKGLFRKLQYASSPANAIMTTGHCSVHFESVWAWTEENNRKTKLERELRKKIFWIKNTQMNHVNSTEDILIRGNWATLCSYFEVRYKQENITCSSTCLPCPSSGCRRWPLLDFPSTQFLCGLR